MKAIPARVVRIGFVAAGLANILGVLAFSHVFTNPLLGERYPEVFSRFGLVGIMLWGAAYLAAAGLGSAGRPLAAVFALEKAVYFGTWLAWLGRHASELPALLRLSPTTGLFFATYGPLDLAFGLFFAAVWAAGPAPEVPAGEARRP